MSARNWIQSAILYEVNPRAFSASGDFKGIRARLDYIAELGVNTIWLMPVHPVGLERRKGTLGSPYAARDHYAIDPAYGSASDLRELVGECHRLGLRIILDIAANHTAWDSALMGESPDWFRRDASGAIVSPEADWSDVAALDYNRAEVRNHMTAVFEHWAREFDFDGFRCDIAAYMPVEFWRQVRRALDRIRPGLFLLAEAEAPELLDGAFDALYAWPSHRAFHQVLMRGASAIQIRQTWERDRERLPAGGIEMRFTDNHDERRAVARFGERGALALAALTFTLDGIPMIYNGQEIGDTTESGAPALFERLPIYWGTAERRPDFPVVYRNLIEMRRAHSAFQTGAVEWVENADQNRVVSFLRPGEGQEFLVVANLSSRPFQGSVDGSPQPVKLNAWGVLVSERRWGKMFEL